MKTYDTAGKLLTVSQTAEVLGMKECTVRLWLSQGKFTYAKLGRSVRIPEDEIERFIALRMIPARESQRRRSRTQEARA
jgi:excisionase family DNA binding protein